VKRFPTLDDQCPASFRPETMTFENVDGKPVVLDLWSHKYASMRICRTSVLVKRANSAAGSGACDCLAIPAEQVLSLICTSHLMDGLRAGSSGLP